METTQKMEISKDLLSEILTLDDGLLSIDSPITEILEEEKLHVRDHSRVFDRHDRDNNAL